jgi:hypothetical protein
VCPLWCKPRQRLRQCRRRELTYATAPIPISRALIISLSFQVAVTLDVTALNAAHNGDPKPYVEEWSRRDPLTLFGARDSVTGGWETLSQFIRALASRFSSGTPGILRSQ